MKRSFQTYVFAAALVLALGVLAPKFSYGSPVAGDSEIEAGGSFTHRQGSDSGSFTPDLSYGYYLTPGWELGLRQSLDYQFVDNARDTWHATTTPFLNYNFNFGRVVPFLGVFVGPVWNDDRITGTLGPNAGIKFFLSDQTYLGLRYRYEWFFHSIRGVENNADHGNHVATLGIGFVWGGAGRANP